MVAATSFFIPLSILSMYIRRVFLQPDGHFLAHIPVLHTYLHEKQFKSEIRIPLPPVRSRQRPAAPRPSRLPRHREGGQPRGEPGRRHRLPGVCREDPPQERNHGQSRQYEKIINFFSSRVVGVLLAPSPHGPMGSKVPTAGLCTRNGASFVLP